MSNPSRRSKRDHEHDINMTLFEYSFKPRSLRRCINNVFREDNNNTTDICISSPRVRPVLTTPEIEMKKDKIKTEAEQFNHCLCDMHSLAGRCRFNLHVVQDNSTVLEHCLTEEYPDTLFYHAGKDTNYSCFLRRSHVAVCRPLHHSMENLQPKQTRFQYVLNCLSNSLKDIRCPSSTTPSPLLTTTAATAAPPQVKIALLVMALLISLLLGVLGTWLGIFCWRRKKRKRKSERPLSPLMTRPEHASQPNLYDSDYGEDHVYDIVKADDSPPQPIPDLLNRAPSLPPMTNRTPKSKIYMEPENSKAAFTKQEDYEPLLRNSDSVDVNNTDPKTPVTTDNPPDYLPLLPDRNSVELPHTVKRVHPYDSVNESEVGVAAQDESITTPKLIDNTEKSPKSTGNEYFILESTSAKPRDSSEKKRQTSSEKSPESDTNQEKTPERTRRTESNSLDSPDDSGYVVSPDAEPDKEDEKHSSDRDSDGYEIPVPEEPTFDIASSFNTKGPRIVNGDDVLDV